MVTDPCPVVGALNRALYETTGASKVNSAAPVPTSEATDRTGRYDAPPLNNSVSWHCTVEAEVHAVV